jgi:hypothetical protein
MVQSHRDFIYRENKQPITSDNRDDFELGAHICSAGTLPLDPALGPFALVIFHIGFHAFCPGLPSVLHPTYTSRVSGISSPPGLVCLLRWGLGNFLPGLALSLLPSAT